MKSWYDRAASVIRDAAASLPAETTLADRIACVDAAYPFGERKMWPYKAWLRARKHYLVPFGYIPKGALDTPLFDGIAESPLDRAKRNAGAA